jgi:hypothetical protein
MSRTRRAICRAAVLVVGLLLASDALAAPHKVLVLPLDGDAEPEVRAKYSASVQRLARVLDGKVTAGDVAFTDTATAIGCDPKAPKCAEDVRATLGVDELVYGTVSKEDGKLVLVVHRVAKGKPPREVTATVEATDSPERAEPEILPVFRESSSTGPGPGDKGSGGGGGTEDPKETPVPPSEPGAPIPRNKVIAYTAIAGGGTLLLISFGLWSSAGGLKDDISTHSTTTYTDLVALRELEDRARTRAWTGDALFVLALGAGGFGGWMLYKERKAQHTMVAPAPVPNGAALMVGGVF